MKKWRCLVCNYIHEGDNPPDECPVCGASSDDFVLVEEEKPVKKWRCLVCNYIHEGDNPPDVCPVCGATKDQFVLVEEEVDEEDKSKKEIDSKETDVVVVGTGAAGLTSAITAKNEGLDVILLEKGEVVGGTSARSGGRYWIPNSKAQKEAGVKDDRDAGIKYMAKYAFPDLYNDRKDNLGLDKNSYELIESYYDTGTVVLDYLSDLGILESEVEDNWKGKPQLDYQDLIPENKGIRGRTLRPKTEAGAGVTGFDYIQLLYTWLEENDVEAKLNHRVTRILENEDGLVEGVEVETEKGIQKIYAKKGVIFGTGGFSHNKDLMRRFQYGPHYGGCAYHENEGDLINMAEELGLKLGNMHNAYRNQSILEQHLDNPGGVNSIFYITGDSVIQVNKYGKRVMNEKRNYNDRARSHFEWDSVKAEWPNKFMFQIMDERTARNWQGMPPMGMEESLKDTPYIIAGNSVEELTENIEKRLKFLEEETSGYTLDSDFKDNLKETIKRFNKFARSGVDEDFNRGLSEFDNEFFTFPPTNPTGIEWPPKDSKNLSMYPIEEDGPFYAFILGPGTLDTNGGPIINKDGQMIRYDGNPVEGLYGAGNCVASPGAASYWGAGATLGSGMIFGYRAVKHLKRLDDR